jgi:hypothetical protein
VKKLTKRTKREDVRDWSRHDGRHAFDGYLEDVMALHAQGVDAADDHSARVFVKDGKVMLVSTKRETLNEIGRALQSGRCGIVGKLAKRPDEETLEGLLRDSPFSRGLPPPHHPARALPAHDDMDGDRAAPAHRARRRSTLDE